MKFLLLSVVVILFGLGFYFYDVPHQDDVFQDDIFEIQELETLKSEKPKLATLPEESKTEPALSREWYQVVKVIDGDTIEVSINDEVYKVRIVGINTPETLDPRKPVECFGLEASKKAKELLDGQFVRLEIDSSQNQIDKYGRLLRYVVLKNGKDFGLEMISMGYAYEYTYITPHRYQSIYRQAQAEARDRSVGLWGDKCDTKKSSTQKLDLKTEQMFEEGTCNIKGNINTKKEKIYHLPGCGSYKDTIINETQGERWFCSPQEAEEAGWRRAGNCI